MKQSGKVKTPCLGRCSTVYGDLICRGCKRFHHEVVDWNRYSDQQKLAVWARLEQLLVQVVQQKIYITDVELLKARLEEFKIKYDCNRSPYLWVYQLIYNAANVIDFPEDFGLQLTAKAQVFSMSQIKQQLDDDFYQLSQAHYDRYFASYQNQLIFE